MFSAAAQKFDLPKGMLESLCFVESGHKINAVHEDDGNSDSLGICQIKLETAQWMGFKGNERQLMDPKINIYYAAKYLNYQRSRYNGSVTKAIIAYNVGHAKNLNSTEYSDKVLTTWRTMYYAGK